MTLSLSIIYFLFSFIFNAICLRTNTYAALKYDYIQPSLVYQMICNGTESKIINKAQIILSYAEKNIENLKENSENRMKSVLKDCDSKYWALKCDEIEIWNETIEDLLIKKGLIHRNLTDIEENNEKIINKTKEIEELFERKINETDNKLEQKQLDLELIEEVEKLIQKELLQNETTQNLIQIVKKTHDFMKMQAKKRFKGAEIGKVVLEILRDIKIKLIKEIKKLKLKKKIYEKGEKLRIFKLNGEKENNYDKTKELENLFAEVEAQQIDLENSVKTCQLIIGNQKVRCLGINQNGTIYLESLNQELTLLDEILSLLA